MVKNSAKTIEREGMTWSDGWAALLRAGAASASGDRNTTLDRLAYAEAALEAANMPQFGAAAKWRRGEVMGAPAGDRLIAEAEDWMRSQGVRRPDRMVAMMAPMPRAEVH